MKTRVLFILIGVLILAGMFLFLKKDPQEKNSTLREFMLDVNAGTEEYPTWQIKEGDPVKVTVNSEIEDEVHLHGYDILKDAKPGEPAVFEFTADKTGRFEMELEGAQKLIAILEVYP